MFKASPPSHSAADQSQRRPPDELRRRTLELAMLELRHQPLLKARAFLLGLLTGLSLAAGAAEGYHWAIQSTTATAHEASTQQPAPTPGN